MVFAKTKLSNDQQLIATLPKVMLSHRNIKNRSIAHDFRYLFNYINQNAENPVSLLYNIGTIIADSEHIVFNKMRLVRYLCYSNSTFSHFFMRHHFHRVKIKEIQEISDIKIFADERHWMAYKLNPGSSFSNILLNFPFLWANNKLVKQIIGQPHPVVNLLQSFCSSIFPQESKLLAY